MSTNFKILPSNTGIARIDERLTALETALLVDTKYETPWIYRTQWSNKHLGSSTTQDVDSNVTHNLNLPLKDLNVRILFSSAGTDATALEAVDSTATSTADGLISGQWIHAIDDNNIKIQTGTYSGARYINDSGGVTSLLNGTAFYYKIVVTANKSKSFLNGFAFKNDVMHVKHTEVVGASGGVTGTVNTWRRLKFNTVSLNEIEGASWNPSTYDGVLPAGKFNINISHVNYSVGRFGFKLTIGNDKYYSTSNYSVTAATASQIVYLKIPSISLTEAKTIYLEYIVQAEQTVGLGYEMNTTLTNYDSPEEFFGEIIVEKIGIDYDERYNNKLDTVNINARLDELEKEKVYTKKYETPWTVVGTITAGSHITITHGLNVGFENLYCDIKLRDPTVPGKIFAGLIYIADYGQIINGVDLNSVYLQSLSGGGNTFRYITDSGVWAGVPTTWEYKVTLMAPNTLSFADVQSSANGILHVVDQKPPNTGGGTFTSGAWRTRVLNTIKTNTILGASVSNNQIVLPPGTYKVNSSAPSYQVTNNQTRLRDVSTGSTLLLGTLDYNHATGYSSTYSLILGTIELTNTTAIELQHRCLTSGQLGVTTSFDEDNIFSVVFIEKIG